ncbi:hypothetical protein [Undibacterium sp.]|uniref:hypothetical protein n=1 Tax=Undibacterium sp. TaxID=1914977 RepID=UPI00374D744F
MNTRTRNYLLTSTTLLILAIAAVCGLMAMMGGDAGWTVNVNGDTVDGFAGAGFAMGGLAIGVIAAIFAIALVGAILAGVSVMLMGIFAFVALVVLLALAPVVLPVLLLIGFIMLVSRKKTA